MAEEIVKCSPMLCEWTVGVSDQIAQKLLSRSCGAGTGNVCSMKERTTSETRSEKARRRSGLRKVAGSQESFECDFVSSFTRNFPRSRRLTRRSQGPQRQEPRRSNQPRRFHLECGLAAGCRRSSSSAAAAEEFSWRRGQYAGSGRWAQPRDAVRGHLTLGDAARPRLLRTGDGKGESKREISSVFAGAVFEKDINDATKG